MGNKVRVLCFQKRVINPFLSHNLIIPQLFACYNLDFYRIHWIFYAANFSTTDQFSLVTKSDVRPKSMFAALDNLRMGINACCESVTLQPATICYR